MSDYSFFVTLTYDQNNIPIRIKDDHPYFVFNKKHVQDYLKRVRYFMNQVSADLKLCYMCVSEYGSIGQRPHYHALIYVKNDKYMHHLKQMRMILRDCWQHGFVTIKAADDANIHYVTKYCVKDIDQVQSGCIDPVFILASKKPYLGYSFESTLERQINLSLEPKVFNHGYAQAMPRIYRNKLGSAGMPGQIMSDHDPRMTAVLESSFRFAFMKSRSEFNQEEFIKFCDSRLKMIERAAIRRQLQRNEKL